MELHTNTYQEVKIVLATNNAHKLDEIREMLADLDVEILSLKDIAFNEDIAETETTLKANAFLKAQHIADRFDYAVIADDSGLEVDALDGAPGVYSARYAGPPRDDNRNMDKLLTDLEGVPNQERTARFAAVIAFVDKDIKESFKGTVEGKIATIKTGEAGFGYDPIFIPEGYADSFAVLGDTIKNSMSHRKHAVDQLKQYLEEYLA